MEKFKYLCSQLGISDALCNRAKNVERGLNEAFQKVESTASINQAKVLEAFWNQEITDVHLYGSTGYGYGDIGREALDRVYAQVFSTEAAYVRGHFVSGTHAIASSLLGILSERDTLIFAGGMPYDTLHGVVGWTKGSPRSLLAKGVNIEVVERKPEGTLDLCKINEAVNRSVSGKTVVHFQRSRGYSWQRSLLAEEIGEATQVIRKENEKAIVFVDNCYGEFVEETEPTDFGVDLMAGSLIKNPGGGLAPWGGYIVGRNDLISAVAEYCTAPGLGRDIGATANTMDRFYQGFFLAPHIVGQAVKAALFAGALCENLGLTTSPRDFEKRGDIIQALRFDNEEQLIVFCQGIQKASPIDSNALPIPGDLPGYDHQVIMAAGTFIQGGSLELSADAPIKSPFIGYLQGGLTYEHAQIGLLKALDGLVREKLLAI